jgi:hypothetical protein
MPAKAVVPGEAFPWLTAFAAMGRLSGRRPAAAWPRVAPTRGGLLVYPPLMRHRSRESARCCRSGPCPRMRWFRSKRFLASTAFGAMGRLSGRWPAAALPRVVPTRGGPLVYPPLMRHRSRESARCCRSGPCPRKRWFRSKRFLASTAFAAMGRLQNLSPFPKPAAHRRGIYKGSSPFWYALRPSRRGPPGPRGGHGPLLQGCGPFYNGRATPPRSGPTVSGSCPSSSATPATGPTARSRPPR